MKNKMWLPIFLMSGLALTQLRCAGCEGTPPAATGCTDLDGDGFGRSCPQGPDCDDNNPELNYSCDCSETVFAGCPCEPAGQSQPCFEADSRLSGIGTCHGGERRCERGKWTTCIGQTLPENERCDRQDNDCDGQVDEGLECAELACGPRCLQEGIGQGSAQGFQVSAQATPGLALDPANNLILDPGEGAVRHSFLWIANSDEGTVSKINTQTGKEEGRYIAALFTAGDPRNRGNAQPNGSRPSRTAVDFNGDVWVANRAFEQQGTVTKIANDECVDINRNGKIDTSRDVNKDGVINAADPGEFYGEKDECILFTVNLGGVNSVPRALALDAGGPDIRKGNAWVGAYTERKVYLLDALSGTKQAEIAVSIQPYGMAIDSKGNLWVVELSTATLVQISTQTRSVKETIQMSPNCLGSYGIAVDRKNRVWVGAYPKEGACRYDPADRSVRFISTPNKGVARGIAADADGNIWLAHSFTTANVGVGRLTRFKADDFSGMRSFDFPASTGTIGVGLDFDGNVWGVNQNTDNACRVVPSSGKVDCFPVGAGPYTYSDFTGYALRNFTSPLGTYKQRFRGCGASSSTRWKLLTWEATIPSGTSVSLYVRVADSETALPSAPRIGPLAVSPSDLFGQGILTGEVMEVEVVLSTQVNGQTPIFKSLSVQRLCDAET